MSAYCTISIHYPNYAILENFGNQYGRLFHLVKKLKSKPKLCRLNQNIYLTYNISLLFTLYFTSNPYFVYIKLSMRRKFKYSILYIIYQVYGLNTDLLILWFDNVHVCA